MSVRNQLFFRPTKSVTQSYTIRSSSRGTNLFHERKLEVRRLSITSSTLRINAAIYVGFSPAARVRASPVVRVQIGQQRLVVCDRRIPFPFRSDLKETGNHFL